MNKSPNIIFHIDCVPHESKMTSDRMRDKYLSKRKFYSCNQEYNFISYVNDGSKQKIDYVNYSGNQEKSSGNFNDKGILTAEQTKDLKNQLRDTKSPIWHGYISFEENFWQKHCNCFESAFNMMKSQFPRFLKSAGFDKNNIVWYAGFHENTSHRHIHFSFFERQETRRCASGKSLEFSSPLINLYHAKRAMYNMELSLTGCKEILFNSRNELVEMFKNTAYINRFNNHVKKETVDILKDFPKTGRISYDSENMESLLCKIDKISDLIIYSDKNCLNKLKHFLKTLHTYDMEVLHMSRYHKIDLKEALISGKYKKDMYRRLGNVVIDVLIKTRDQNQKLEIKAKSHLARKRNKKKVLENSIMYSLYLAEKVQREFTRCFEEHMAKLEEMKFKVLSEQGME